VVIFVLSFPSPERLSFPRIRRRFVTETVRHLTRIGLGMSLGLTTLATVAAAPADYQ
jgi:hypothetical protein